MEPVHSFNKVNQPPLFEGQCIKDNTFLQEIAGKFHAEIVESSYSDTVQNCIEAIEKAYKENNWHLIEEFDHWDGQDNLLSKLKDHSGQTLLMRAVKNSSVVDHLIRHKVGIHEVDFSGNTALHVAAQSGAVQSLPLLLKHLSFAQRNHQQETPIHLAIQKGQVKALEILIAEGANFNEPLTLKVKENQIRVTPFLYAMMRGELGCLVVLMNRLIHDNEKLIDQTVKGIGSLIHVGVYFSQVQLIDYLLRSKSFLDHLRKNDMSLKRLLETPNDQGMTPLCLAASLGQTVALQLLYDKGASLETEDLEKRRPLHHAALACHHATVQVIVALNCDLRAIDGQAHTAHGALELKSFKITIKPTEMLSTINFLSNVMQAPKTARLNFELQLPRNLSFKGGGPKGIVYAGVLKALEENRVIAGLKRISGTSAGSITAVLVALGWNSDRVGKLLETTNLLDFMDPPNKDMLLLAMEERETASSIKTAWRVLRSVKSTSEIIFHPVETIQNLTGICAGKELEEWMESLIYDTTKIPFLTFGEFSKLIEEGKPYKHFIIFSTQITNKQSVFRFSSEDPACKNMVISRALRLSVSIPGAFVPEVIIEKFKPIESPCDVKTGIEMGNLIKRPEKGSFVDGGLLYNLPVEAFDEKRFLSRDDLGEEGFFPTFNTETMGFDLCTAQKDPVKSKNISTIVDLVKGIALTYLNSEDLLRQMNPYNATRIVKIDTGDVGTLSFNATEKQKKMLVESGYQSTMSYFQEKMPHLSRYPTAQSLKSALNGKISLPPSLAEEEFIGREAQLSDMNESLQSWSAIEETRILLISGESGMGKTELALTFANRQMENLSLIKFIQCKEEATYHRGYLELATVLNISIKNKSLKELVNEVNEALETRSFVDDGQKAIPWLIIFDNSDKNLPLPKRGGIVCITSETKGLSIQNARVISLPLLNDGNTEKIWPLSPKESRSTILKLFNGSPLLLMLAKKSIRAASFPSIEEYLKTVSSKEQVFEFILHHLKTINPSSFEFLSQIVYLNTDCLETALTKCLKIQNNEEILVPLKQWGLVREDKQQETFSCHQTLRTALIKNENQEQFDKAVGLLSTCSELFDPQDKDAWKIGAFLFEQLVYLQKNPFWTDCKGPGQASSRMKCLNQAGRWLVFSQNRAKEALELQKQALKLGKDFTHNLSETYKNMGICYFSLKDYSKAIEKYKDALSGTTDVNQKAELLIYLGDAYYANREFDEAKRNYQDSLNLKPKDQLHAALVFMLIADTLVMTQGYCPDTFDYYTKALEIWKQVNGSEDQRYAKCLNNKGLSQSACKDVTGAMKSHQESLGIQKKLFGDRHPDIANSLFYIGSLQKMCSPKEAIQSFEKAIKIWKALKDKQEIAFCYLGLGDAYMQLKEGQKASKFYAKSFQSFKESVKVLSESGNKHDLIQIIDRFFKACAHLDKQDIGNLSNEILPSCRKILGDQHPTVVKLSNYNKKETCIIA